MTSGHARWAWTLDTAHGAKSLELIHGDLCDMQAQSDVVVCSAFKGDHVPTRTSLIGALLMKNGECKGLKGCTFNPSEDGKNHFALKRIVK